MPHAAAAAAVAEPSLFAQQRLQVEHHPAGKFVRETREAEALVELRSGFVDRIGHKKAERNRAALRELEGQPESLLEQIPAKTLPLHALIDGKTREQHSRDRKAGQPLEGFHRIYRTPLHTGRSQSEVPGEAFCSRRTFEGKKRTGEEILLGMPQRETSKVFNEGPMLIAEVLE